MRKLITGTDDNGRSCLVEMAPIETQPAGAESGVDIARLFATEQSPPPAASPAAGEWIDKRLAPGVLRWNVVDHHPFDESAGPTTATTLHHGDSIDLLVVMDGSMLLVLDDGEHALEPGDCVIMPGVDHATKAGRDGCRLLALSIGTPPRA